MLIELASHNDDIRRLLDKGFALREDGGYLVVRDIPYLDAQSALQWGAFVTKLEHVDGRRVKQDDHQVYFAGGVPHGLDGQPVRNLAGGPRSITLGKNDVIVQRSFSNKPAEGFFPDFYEKIIHYLNLISGPAMERYKAAASPFTFRVDHDEGGPSVFKFRDTMTSRAELGDLAVKFKHEVIAMIGLGGTGGYLLDFVVKMPAKEVRCFDGDAYYVHNAYRSPGRLQAEELGKPKADVFRDRYANFREGLTFRSIYLTEESASELQGVTFAFVSVDKGSARAEIFDLLIRLKIPFIDVGMGLDRKQGPISGALRVTYYSAADAQKVRNMQLAEMVDHPNDLYRTAIQIGELNALNACLAMVKYKQIRGFYLDEAEAYHLLMRVESLKTYMPSSE